MTKYLIKIIQNKPCRWKDGSYGFKSFPDFDEISDRSSEEIRLSYLRDIGEGKVDVFDVSVTVVDV